MSVDLDLVHALETRMMNAWPAIYTQMVEQWIVRLANGYSGRANSASALAPGSKLSDSTRAHVESLFDAAGIRPLVRITPLADASVDAELTAAGWRLDNESLVLVAPLSGRERVDPSASLVPRATEAWAVANAASYGGVKANAEHLYAIVSRIRPAAVFATLREDGEAVAWGIGVTERGFVALQDLVVHPKARGRGLGRRLTTTLMAAGQKAGATRAYLQVSEENRVARELYEKLGFTEAYRYTQRVRPDGAVGI
jgi:ribosomal protein S18 acetylase RimI-like enzyme